MSAPSTPVERGEVLVAGAGTGKTYALVTRVLARLEGVDPRGAAAPLPPSALVVLTFTNKAAGELGERIRQRVLALARGEPDAALAELAGDRPRRPRETWATEVLPRLSEASVGTFHAFGQSLLRSFAVEAGLPSDFTLIAPDEAQELMRAAVEAAVLERLGAGDAEVSSLLARVPPDRLVRALVQVRQRLANEGHDAARSPPETPLDAADPGRAGAEAAALGQQIVSLVDGLVAIDEVKLKSAKAARATIERLRSVWGAPGAASPRPALLAAAADPAEWRSPDALLALARLERARPDARSSALREPAKALRESLEALPRLLDAWELAPLYPALARLTTAIERQYRDAKTERGLVDHDDLLLRARDLLRDRPAVRRALKQRVGAVLIDEFQDTNLVQLELVALLAERREAEARLSPDRLALPTPEGPVELEPGLLVLVGDPKQAIYEFRGADVGVFNASVATLTGEPTRLVTNRRSVPEVLAFANALSAHMFLPSDLARAVAGGGRFGAGRFRVEYDPEAHDLRAHRAPVPGLDPVEILEVDAPDGAKADELAQLDAAAITARVRALLDAGRPPGEIAVLARASAVLGPVQRALEAAGIPAVLAGGSGFYRSQEVADLVALARVLVDPDDAAALALVLRGPLTALSDPELLRLAYAAGPSGPAWTRPDLARGALAEDDEALAARAGLDASSRARLEPVRRWLGRLRAELDRVPLSALLRLALDETGYAAAVAAGPLGESRVANLERLLVSIAETERERPVGGAAAVVRRFAVRIRDGAAAAPAVVEPLGGALRLMTVHASKGLEFPVVVLAGLGSAPPLDLQKVVYHRSTGLLLTDDKTHALQGLDVLRQRRDEEERRLLYVAVTRARDKLVLAGLGRPRPSSWGQRIVDMLVERPEVEAGIVRVPPVAGVTPKARAVVHAIGEGRGALARRRAAVAALEPPAPPATEVGTGALAAWLECPRRHHVTARLGLHEPGRARLRPPSAGLGRRIRDALRAAADLGPLFARAQIEAALDAAGLPAEAPSRGAAADAIAALAASSAGAALMEGQLRPDVPYVVALDTDVVVRGRLDLLSLTPGGDVRSLSLVPHAGPEAEARAALDAMAGRALAPGAGRVSSVLVVLDGSGAPRAEARSGKELESVRERARVAARALAASDRAGPGLRPGVERTTCELLGCGFLPRCHPD